MTHEKLPLKKVVIRQADYFRPHTSGSPPKLFGPVTPEVRNRVAGQVGSVGVHFQQAFAAYPKAAAIARVALKEEALAKTHRPSKLFESVDCPIVGVGGFGELLVSVRPSTLPRLEAEVLQATAKESVANISTIRVIEPFTLQGAPLAELVDVVARDATAPLKLRLFKHGDEAVDTALRSALVSELRAMRIHADPISYGAGLSVFKLQGVRAEHVQRLGAFVGTQSLAAFPEYHVVRPAAQPVGKLTAATFPAPEKGVDYPIVGLIDSGISPLSAHMAPWISGREFYVPESVRDYEHGTFVAGLLIHARSLNHGDIRFPECPCRVLDVVAIPASGRIREDELLAIIREVVPRHPEVRVWNVSLSGSTPCTDYAFSDLAIALDEIQTTSDVTFVLAAGNYATPPFRDWPPSGPIGEADRICGPADSMRSLTVGSIAHRDSPTARVTASSPSPFSRRGPAPAYVPKPEVSHFGGNCDSTGQHAQIGILSVDALGNLAESIGTSFASPLVAALLAHVQNRPIEPLSNCMAKALVIHSAALAKSDLTSQDLRYRGFGMPQSVDEILGCDPWHATLLFEIEIRAGEDLQREPFPIPACLRDIGGLFKGEMFATLVYEPPLSGGFGAEYCRTNVSVSLGTYDPEDGQDRQVNPFPPRGKANAAEKALIEQGFKWSPVKVYHRRMPRGVAAPTWRLVVDATDRSGASNEKVRAALVVTVADLAREARVYNDVVIAMNQLGWAVSDVKLRTAIRPRAA
jgi:serine protease AprX